MSIADSLSDVAHWWRWESRALFGGRAPDGAAGCDVVLRLGRDGVRVESGRADAPAFEPPLVGETGAVGGTVRELVGRWRARPSVALLVEPDRYLKRRLAAMRLPRSRLAAMARLDVQSQTPFEPDALFLIFPDYDAAVSESAYYAVKKAFLAPLLDDLRQAGLTPAFLGLVEGARVVAADAASRRRVVGRPLAHRAARRLVAASALAAVVGLASLVGLAHWRYASAGQQLDAALAEAQREVAELRGLIAARDRKIAQIGAVRQEKQAAVPVVSILEEMSRAIPDSTWLTEVTVNGDRVSFAGFSASAATLIPLLEASPLFSQPSFMEPVVRAGDQQGERFSISMQVEAAGG